MLRQHRPPGLLTEIAFAGVPGDCKRQTGTGSGRGALNDRVEERSACAGFDARRVVDDAVEPVLGGCHAGDCSKAVGVDEEAAVLRYSLAITRYWEKS